MTSHSRGKEISELSDEELKSRLSPNQLKAINNLMSGFPKNEALKKAGYGETSQRAPTEILNHPVVQEELRRRKDRLIKANELSEQWIVDRLVRIADASIGDLIDFNSEGSPFLNFDKLTPELRAAIGGMEVSEQTSGRGTARTPVRKMKVTMKDSLRALEMLGKYLGMFKDKIEFSGDQELVNRLYKARERVNADS